MQRDVYRIVTLGLASFLLTGLFLGLSSYIGIWFIKLLGFWQVQIVQQLSSVLMVLAVSSFFISPILAAIVSVYIGYELDDRSISMMASLFTGFVGFFILNLVALAILLQAAGNISPTDLESPYRILYAFLSLENSVALFSFPTIITSIFAAYLGFDLKLE